MSARAAGNLDDYDLAYSLGGAPVRLLDLTAGYGAFANGGSRLTPRLILEVEDASGDLLFSAAPPTPVRALDERVAWLISDILSDNDARLLSFGRNSILKLDRPAAVKTGTSNNFRDNWTVGYTPDLVVGVWVGNADNEPMEDVTGVSGAGPIWHQFMRTVLAGEPEMSFPQPPGLVQTEICAMSGALPSEACPYRRREWFLAGTQPTLPDTFFKRVTIDSRTGRLADDLTPPQERVDRLALDLPAELHPWARAEGLTLLDDLLMENKIDGDIGVGIASVGSAPGSTLRLLYPDPQAIFRLSASLPPEAQQLRFEAVADVGFSQVSLWVDGGARFTTDSTAFEVRDVNGE